jgi:hypothetical protein
MKSLKMEQENVLALIRELRELKTLTIMPKESAFDEYLTVDKLSEANDLL